MRRSSLGPPEIDLDALFFDAVLQSAVADAVELNQTLTRLDVQILKSLAHRLAPRGHS
jgi:hypothetical protein